MSALPRVPLLAAAPTPLQHASRLSEAIGLEVWLKRDDLTGLGLGGNKVRGLEYLLADAERQGCDCLVTGAGPQSNWAMLAALAARTRGLDTFLVFYGAPAAAGGNLLLTRLADADIRYTGDPARDSVDAGIAACAGELTAAGRHPYALPRGGATPLGSVGYVAAAEELAEQCRAAGLAPRTVWLATGSCGTQAGLVAGTRWLRLPQQVVGVTVSRDVPDCARRVAALAAGAASLLGLDAPADAAGVEVLGGHIGPGYGHASEAGQRAAELVARTEGVLLDPVFGAKAMGALVAAAHRVEVAEPVVFLVSGGAPTLFTAAEVMP